MATDDERIYDAVTAFGGKAEMTSAEHRSGTDRCWEAYCKHGGDFDVVINVQGDEPFIQPSQLEAIKHCFDREGTDIATLVKPFAESDGLEALENPNSPKVVLDNEGCAMYFSRSIIPYLRGIDRNEWLARHTFYKHIGIYAFRTDVLRPGYVAAAIDARKGGVARTVALARKRIPHRCRNLGRRDHRNRHSRRPRPCRGVPETNEPLTNDKHP